MDTTESLNREQMLQWDFANVQDDVNPDILRILEGTFFALRNPIIDWFLTFIALDKSVINTIIFISAWKYILLASTWSALVWPF